MKLKVIRLFIASSVFITPFFAQADPLIDHEITKEVVQYFNTKDCVKVCQKIISGTTIEIMRVDINFDKKPEYRVSLTECGSAGCGAAIFMYRDGAWVKLIEGWGMHVLKSKTKGFADLGSGRGKLTWDGRNYK